MSKLLYYLMLTEISDDNFVLRRNEPIFDHKSIPAISSQNKQEILSLERKTDDHK